MQMATNMRELGRPTNTKAKESTFSRMDQDMTGVFIEDSSMEKADWSILAGIILICSLIRATGKEEFPKAREEHIIETEITIKVSSEEDSDADLAFSSSTAVSSIREIGVIIIFMEKASFTEMENYFLMEDSRTV